MESKLTVLKIGGGGGLDLEAISADIAWLHGEDHHLVVVHGASARADRLAHALNHPPVFLSSPSGHISRYTDPRTRDIFVRAAEEENRELVSRLRARGVPARGLVGPAVALQGERKRALRAVVDGRLRVIRDDYSGRVTGVAAGRLRALLARRAVPVLPPLAWSPTDGLLNVDGDRAAAAVAVALGAACLVLLTNVPGLLRDPARPESLVPTVPAPALEQALAWARGRMKRKVLAAGEALAGGVPLAIIADGRSAAPIRRALTGAGTHFVAGERLEEERLR